MTREQIRHLADDPDELRKIGGDVDRAVAFLTDISRVEEHDRAVVDVVVCVLNDLCWNYDAETMLRALEEAEAIGLLSDVVFRASATIAPPRPPLELVS
jgi:hypothetical protein